MDSDPGRAILKFACLCLCPKPEKPDQGLGGVHKTPSSRRTSFLLLILTACFNASNLWAGLKWNGQGEILDDVVKSVRPLWVLELRMHCGYSSGRLLRLLPHGGRLITVVLDPVTADLGEEIILVAGFKQSQFQVFTQLS
ncbi:catechol O-methyltransferase-like isoform X2 [Maylandia zebra]|uniref:catechol O-methyltransferase-like isoform X2 n=1 Tax=Astatotilapia calliptera TaxID=8154 RepID=UPI000E41359B|nr:catechol O-methyltransferase-like isoform X2 [Astatotilapia calliptera]